MAETTRDEDWTPAPYVSGEPRPRGENSIFAPAEKAAPEGPRAFVTGWPVWHSRSPTIHGTWLKEFGIPGSYSRLGVPPEEIDGFLSSLRPGEWVGGNVTVPHKVAAFAAAGRLDGEAEAIGAVNTLWFEGDALVGGNTDAYGFSANLDERLPGWSDAEFATVIGAGGAARAVVHALVSRGVRHVAILNRTPSRAEALAARFGARASAHGEDARPELLSRTELLVNTAPYPSKSPEEEALPAFVAARGPALPDLSPLPEGALVTDIVYVPLETPILRAARARGLAAADGLGMLLHQAVPGFERWFGRRPTVSDALRARIVSDIESGL
jgi:shikimate dehydrogenase